jgi:arylsulfatase A-like enzyme
VPLIFAIPGVTTSHRPVENVASVVDVAPTVLDFVGLPIPPGYEGRSLLVPGAQMALFYTDYSVGLLGLQDGCFKYQLDIEAPRSRLFNTCVDPEETIDLAPTQPDRVRVYADRLKDWSSATRDRILSRR